MLDMYHDHLAMIDLNPLVVERFKCKPPSYAPTDEYWSTWYTIKGKLHQPRTARIVADGLKTKCHIFPVVLHKALFLITRASIAWPMVFKHTYTPLSVSISKQSGAWEGGYQANRNHRLNLVFKPQDMVFTFEKM